MKRTKVNADACFSSHIIMHSLFGLGLGIFLVSLIHSLDNWLIGIVVMIIAAALDVLRKN